MLVLLFCLPEVVASLEENGNFNFLLPNNFAKGDEEGDFSSADSFEVFKYTIILYIKSIHVIYII